MLGFLEGWDRGHARTFQIKAHAPQDSDAWALDSIGRVEGHERGPVVNGQVPVPGPRPPAQRAWTLDGLGNWQRVDAETREHNAFNEITRRTLAGRPTDLTYDDAGNLLDDGTQRYTWDAVAPLLASVYRSVLGAQSPAPAR